jgi:hypothetical protein
MPSRWDATVAGFQAYGRLTWLPLAYRRTLMGRAFICSPSPRDDVSASPHNGLLGCCPAQFFSA